MANVNNPFGLKPEGRNFGGGFSDTNTYLKPVAYAFACFKWDPVTLVAGGNIGVPADTGPAITPGTTQYLGVAVNWAPASTASSHQVIDHPDAVFSVQEDNSGGGNVTFAKMGYLANLSIATAGGGVTRDNSGAQLSGTSINTTNTLDVRMERLVPSLDGNAYGAYGVVEVRFNKHLKNFGVTGV